MLLIVIRGVVSGIRVCRKHSVTKTGMGVINVGSVSMNRKARTVVAQCVKGVGSKTTNKKPKTGATGSVVDVGSSKSKKRNVDGDDNGRSVSMNRKARTGATGSVVDVGSSKSKKRNIDGDDNGRSARKGKKRVAVSANDSDDDFQTPMKRRKEVVQERVETVVGPKEVPYTAVFDKLIRVRNPLINLCVIIDCLTVEQWKEVEKMGFGSVWLLKISQVPTKLGYWLLTNYDHVTNSVNVGTHKIQITKEMVKDVLGIPMGEEYCNGNK
ncbi:uncharacterized protein LOC143569346 [Bidens hawaiensis]|uniref:uncharacterized protein LOC143569346 n=1 Tax=Bidens hawaiensis TaxID=980011 RepID=UPI00404B0CB8